MLLFDSKFRVSGSSGYQHEAKPCKHGEIKRSRRLGADKGTRSTVQDKEGQNGKAEKGMDTAMIMLIAKGIGINLP